VHQFKLPVRNAGQTTYGSSFKWFKSIKKICETLNRTILFPASRPGSNCKIRNSARLADASESAPEFSARVPFMNIVITHPEQSQTTRAARNNS
jgi:hypothetical protein